MRRLLTVLLALCLALTLAACGGSAETPERTEAPAQTERPGAEETAAAPQQAETAAPAAEDAPAAAEEWTGVYCKCVGDSDGVTDEPFRLVLNADGTGTHYRDDLEIPVTWTLSGEDFAMRETLVGVIDYTGTLSGGVLHIFNGDPADVFTYEYVYGQGDVSGIEVPRSPADDSPLGRLRGDWNGAFKLRDCTGEYQNLEGAAAAAIARFYADAAGNVTPFIAINFIGIPIQNLTIRYDGDGERYVVGGDWDGAHFEDVPLGIENGTLSLVLPIVKPGGATDIVINLRRLDDEGWTDEDPRLSEENIEYCKGMSFDDLAVVLGYDFMDYPPSDRG